MKRFSRTLILSFLALVQLPSCENHPVKNETGQPKSHQQFKEAKDTEIAFDAEAGKIAREAIKDGMVEIAMSKALLERSKNTEVRFLAETVKSDHEESNQELRNLATKYHWEMPRQLPEKYSHKPDVLQHSITGKLDSTYLYMTVKSHKEAIKKLEKADSEDAFQKEEKAGPLVAWIKKELPVLHQHLEMAQGLQKKD